MTKKIRNKVVKSDGRYSLYMERFVGDRPRLLVIHLSPREVSLGRTHIARRITDFRRDMSKSLSKPFNRRHYER